MRELWHRVDPEFHANERFSCLARAAAYGQVSLVDWFLDVWDSWTIKTRAAALWEAVVHWRFEVVDLPMQRCEYAQTVRYKIFDNACDLKSSLAGRDLPETL